MRDIIEANHIYLKMLEDHKKKGLLNVQCKKKKKRVVKKKSGDKKKKSGGKKRLTKEEKAARKLRELNRQKRVDEQTDEFKTHAWEENSSRVGALFRNETEFNVENDDLMPFDFVASDADFDAQKDRVVEKIQHFLGDGKPDDSIALFREARFLFGNEKSLFGSPGISADEEYEVYKELIMKKLFSFFYFK